MLFDESKDRFTKYREGNIAAYNICDAIGSGIQKRKKITDKAVAQPMYVIIQI